MAEKIAFPPKHLSTIYGRRDICNYRVASLLIKTWSKRDHTDQYIYMLYILYLFFLIYCLTLKFVKSRPLLVISFPSIFPLFPHPISNYDFVISSNSPDPAGVLPFKAISSSLNCKLPSSSPTFCTPLLKSPRNASYLVTIPYTALPK